MTYNLETASNLCTHKIALSNEKLSIKPYIVQVMFDAEENLNLVGLEFMF